jgi:hypothetical protein
MTTKEFYDLLNSTESDMEYPYGSCQYETVRIGYLATKKAIEDHGFDALLRAIYDEDQYLVLMRDHKNKDAFLKEVVLSIIWGSLLTNDQDQAELQWKTLNDNYKKVPLISVLHEDWTPTKYWDEGEFEARVKDLESYTDIQEAITWAADNSFDLWSFPVPVPYPDLEAVLKPDVGGGPILNVMAWGDGFAQGISMAVLEGITETEYDWERWDT